MNTDNHKRFEDRLLAELDQIVAERPAPAPAPKRQRVGWKPRVAMGASALALGAAAVVVPTVADHGTEPAFAVTEKQRNGEEMLYITINELKDPEALERELARRGIKADVTYLPDGKMCKQPRYDDSRSALQVNLGNVEPGTFAVDADDRGQTLVLELSEKRAEGGDENAAMLMYGGAYAKGKVAPCTPVSQ